MNNLFKLIMIILMALISFKAYGKGVVRHTSLDVATHHDNTIYELILDFGDDFVFIHEVTKSKSHCEFRARVIMIKEDDVKAYCVERKW